MKPFGNVIRDANITQNRSFRVITILEIEKSGLKSKNYHKNLLPQTDTYTHILALTLTHKDIRTQTYNHAVLEQLRNPESN